MKALRKHIRWAALAFSMLLWIQSCAVYKNAPITLDEATNSNVRIKVHKKNGEQVKYAKIVVLKDGHYYGVKKKNRLEHPILIHENDIEKIEIKDQRSTTFLSIGIPIFIIVAAIGDTAFGSDLLSY